MSLFGTGRREGCLAILLLVVLGVVIHAPGLFFGRHRLAADPGQLPPHQQATSEVTAPLEREAGVNQSIVVPAMQRAGGVVSGGELPLWNPDARFGEPFSITGAPVLYPLFWPLMLPSGWQWLELVMYLHTALACLVMYRFLRALPLSRYTAFIGGGLYGFGWFLTAQMDRLPTAAACALLPLALELTQRVTVSSRRERHGPLLALAIALMFWTGGTEVAGLACALCTLWFLSRIPAIERSDRRRTVQTAGMAVALAAMLTAPVWLDAVQNGPASVERELAGNGPETGALVGLMAANAFGDLHGTKHPGMLDGQLGSDPIELVLYPGAIALFLIVLGLFRPKRHWIGLFWVLVGGVGLLLTLDPFGASAYGWPRGGHPGAALVLTHLAAVVLASIAMENFFEAPAARPFVAPLTSAMALLAVAAWGFSGYLWPTLGEQAVAGVLALDTPEVISAAARELRVALLPCALGLTLISVLFLIWRRLGMLRFKFLLACVALAEVLVVSTWSPPRTAQTADPTAYAGWLPHVEGRLATVAGSPLPPGGIAMASGVAILNTDSNEILDRTARYLRLVDPHIVEVGPRARVRPLTSSEQLEHPLLAAGRLQSGASAQPFEAEGFEPTPAAPGAAAAAAAGPLVASRPTATPRARLVYDGVHSDSPEETVRKLGNLFGALDQAVVVEGADPDFVPKVVGAKATLETVEERTNTLRYRVSMGIERGYLVISDAWAPGWHARVDGESAPVLPANLAFRAIPLTEGDHEVEVYYSPLSAWLGLPLLLLGLVLAGALSALFWLRR